MLPWHPSLPAQHYHLCHELSRVSAASPTVLRCYLQGRRGKWLMATGCWGPGCGQILLAGARHLQHAVLGAQVRALLQFCQQSICTERPGSGTPAISCPPCLYTPPKWSCATPEISGAKVASQQLLPARCQGPEGLWWP